MKKRFGQSDEDRLRESFVTTLPVALVRRRRVSIQRACGAFGAVVPGESILNHSHSTQWVSAWKTELRGFAPETIKGILCSLYAWWKWLFRQGEIDDNVLDFVACERLAAEDVPPLVLRTNLQRQIAEHLASMPSVSDHTRESYAVWLKDFNVFVNSDNRLASSMDRLAIGEDLLASWFRTVCPTRPRVSVMQAASVIGTFLDALVRKGVVDENPLCRLQRAHPVGKRLGIAYALASPDRADSLKALVRPPTFRSNLAAHFAGFLALKRAVGCKYTHGTSILRDFDRFLAEQRFEGPITSQLLARWHALRPGLSAESHRGRQVLMRQFCVYLHRYHPETYVPDPLLGQRAIPRLRPRIVGPEQLQVLLAAVPEVASGRRFPLRPHTYRVLFILLYTTGLRISEARTLRLVDVDLGRRFMVIRETKFGKSRIVPFSDGLLELLREYLATRQQLLGPAAGDAPFFVTQYGRHYSKTSIGTVWQKLLRATQMGGGRGKGPRIHDLRHSFATLRLLAWYREGVDVEARLPVLSTFLGHSSVGSTQRYLTILPEIQQAASERFRQYGGTIICPEGPRHEFA